MTDEKLMRLDMGTLDSNFHSERPILCLGIESSCDETSAAIVDSDRNILSHIIYSQIPEHQRFGGVSLTQPVCNYKFLNWKIR